MIHSSDEHSVLLALSVAFNGKTKMPATYFCFVFGQKRDLDEQKMINNKPESDVSTLNKSIVYERRTKISKDQVATLFDGIKYEFFLD